jgi:hypothetical protein
VRELRQHLRLQLTEFIGMTVLLFMIRLHVQNHMKQLTQDAASYDCHPERSRGTCFFAGLSAGPITDSGPVGEDLAVAKAEKSPGEGPAIR